MTQAPATSKARRLRNLVGAALGLALPGRANLAPAETAALTLRRVKSREHWAAPQDVTFLLPLVGPESVGDWERVCRLLTDTLHSFTRQSDPRWRAIVCCQTRPPLPDDSRIRFLSFTAETPGNDKWAKLATLYGALGQDSRAPGLAMTFDADDRANPNLVASALATRGLLLTHGYVWDVSADQIARATPQSLTRPGAKAFWKLCGSCAALPYDPTQASWPDQQRFLQAMSQHEHRMIPYLARLAGTPLKASPQASALYLLNHGENFGARRGRVSFKTRFVERFEITDPQQLKELRASFDLAASPPTSDL